MKLNLITSALVLSSALMAGQVFASDGTVHFRGEIIDSTCKVTPATKDQNVDLGKVNKTAFTGVDSIAAPQQFQIDLEDCPATYAKAAIVFDGTEATGGNGDLAIGDPLNTTTPGDYTQSPHRLLQRASLSVFTTVQITASLNCIKLLQKSQSLPVKQA
jgi:P pilus assembly protein, pilin FimA